MQLELAGLRRAYPLPAGLSEPELFEGSVTIAGREVRRVGLACRSTDGAEVTGSAAELDRSPLARAYFELLERASLLEARGRLHPLCDARGRVLGALREDAGLAPEGTPVRPARSNGLALHLSFEEACRRAALELAERDRVLRAWYGELPVAPAAPPALLAPFDTHEWRACAIAEEGDAAEVAAVIGFPRRPELPLARGFGAAASLGAALEAAAREAVQNLAFLWDEPVPAAAPESAPRPMFHLDYYLYPGHHAHLARWLDGAHHRPSPRAPRRGEPRFVDLTPASLRGKLSVARAVSDGARPLVFGEVACPPPGLPGSHVHPIP